MAAAGSIATYSNELVGCLEDLREKREDLHRSLLRDVRLCGGMQTRPRAVTRREQHARLLAAAARRRRRCRFHRPRPPHTLQEEEKARIQKELTTLTERLGQLNNDLAKKINTRNEFDAAISETEGACAWLSLLDGARRRIAATAAAAAAGYQPPRSPRVPPRRRHEDPRVQPDAAVRAQARVDAAHQEEGHGASAQSRRADECRVDSGARIAHPPHRPPRRSARPPPRCRCKRRHPCCCTLRPPGPVSFIAWRARAAATNTHLPSYRPSLLEHAHSHLFFPLGERGAADDLERAGGGLPQAAAALMLAHDESARCWCLISVGCGAWGQACAPL